MRVLFIENITRNKVRVLWLLRRQFDQIYYFTMAPEYRTEAMVDSLRQAGLFWFNSNSVSQDGLNELLGLYWVHNRFADDVVESQLDNSRLYRALRRVYLTDDRSATKYRCSLKHDVACKFSDDRTWFTWMAWYQRENPVARLAYWPDHGSRPLLARHLPLVYAVPRFCRWWLSLAAAGAFLRWCAQFGMQVLRAGSFRILRKHAAIHRLWRSMRTGGGKKEQEPDWDSRGTDCEVAYFPHLHITHAKNFHKNFLYSSAPDSPLRPGNIVHVFNDPTDRLSRTYLRLLRSPWLALNRAAFYRWEHVFFDWFKFVTGNAINILHDYFRGTDPLIIGLLIRNYLQIRRYELLVSHFPKLKAVIAYFDVLFPRLLNVVLARNRIASITVQERSNASLYHHNFMNYDFHLSWGESAVNTAQTVGRCQIDHYLPVGPVRTDLIHRYTRHPQLPKYAAIKNKYFYIMAFDVHGAENVIEDGFRVGGLFRQNQDFYQALLGLVERHPAVFISIKGKTTAHYQDENNNSIVEQVLASPRMEIINNRNNIGYKLVPYSDLIIVHGHSSIGDEAICAGKRVLHYDNIGILHGLNHPYRDHGLVVHNARELFHRVARIIEHDDYLPAGTLEKLRGDFFSNTYSDGKIRERIRQRIEAVIAGRKDDGAVIPGINGG